MADVPTFATVRELCTFALKNCGIIGLGQTAGAEQISDAHTYLRGMMKSWRENRWLVFRLVDSSFVGNNAQTHTIGPTGDIVVDVRPSRLEGAYVVQLQPGGGTQISWPLGLIQSREDYSMIALKTLQSVPGYIFYDPTLPNGTLYPWPIPSSLYEVHVLTKHILDDLGSLNDTLAGLPNEYAEALWSNLAVRVSAMKGGVGVSLSKTVEDIARASLANIKSANYAIGQLGMPKDLASSPGQKFNVYTGFPY